MDPVIYCTGISTQPLYKKNKGSHKVRKFLYYAAKIMLLGSVPFEFVLQRSSLPDAVSQISLATYATVYGYVQGKSLCR